jgi:hypothetical protein
MDIHQHATQILRLANENQLDEHNCIVINLVL